MSSGIKENELTNLEVLNQGASINNEQIEKTNYCCLARCVKWYFDPIIGNIKYSLIVMLFHIVNFIIAWLAIGIDIMLLISVGLFAAFCFGFVTFYISCELLLSLARLDLTASIKMVEDDEVLKKRAQYLQRPLTFTMPSRSLLCKRSVCPCIAVPAQQNDTKFNNMSCCSLLYDRIATIVTTWRMYSIIFYYLIVKPIIVLLTCLQIILVCYALFMVLTPLVYLIRSELYTSGQLCGVGGSSCNDNGTSCHCYGILVSDFGTAIGVSILGFILLPLTVRLDNGAAILSKIVTYYFLTPYYQDGDTDQNQQLLYTNNV